MGVSQQGDPFAAGGIFAGADQNKQQPTLPQTAQAPDINLAGRSAQGEALGQILLSQLQGTMGSTGTQPQQQPPTVPAPYSHYPVPSHGPPMPGYMPSPGMMPVQHPMMQYGTQPLQQTVPQQQPPLATGLKEESIFDALAGIVNDANKVKTTSAPIQSMQPHHYPGTPPVPQGQMQPQIVPQLPGSPVSKNLMGDLQSIVNDVNQRSGTPTGTGEKKHKAIFQDLSSRFIMNIPSEDRSDFNRIFFQIELAHWFYIDNYCESDTSLKRMKLKPFVDKMFSVCPLLQPFIKEATKLYEEWREYKFQVPVYGAIILTPTLDKCLMVQGMNKGSTWGFPRGKVNQDEAPEACAIREVYEEVGFDITPYLNKDDYIDHISPQGRFSRLYIVAGVPESQGFATQTRYEIGDIKWHYVDGLPDAMSKHANANSVYFMALPFVRPLKKWIKKQLKALDDDDQSTEKKKKKGKKGKKGDKQKQQTSSDSNDAELNEQLGDVRNALTVDQVENGVWQQREDPLAKLYGDETQKEVMVERDDDGETTVHTSTDSKVKLRILKRGETLTRANDAFNRQATSGLQFKGFNGFMFDRFRLLSCMKSSMPALKR